ncbi:hypothetical protein D3C71_1303310 [compost metagenome]
MQQADAGQHHEVLDIHVAQRAHARRGKAVAISRRRFRHRHEFSHVLGRQIRVDGQNAGHRQHIGHGREILHGVVIHLAIHGRVRAMRAHRGHAQRVAVGRGPRHLLHAHRATRARLVLDHDGLLQVAAGVLGHQAGHDIGRSTGGERHHQLDGARGVVGGLGNAGKRQGGEHAGKRETRGPAKQAARHESTPKKEGVGFRQAASVQTLPSPFKRLYCTPSLPKVMLDAAAFAFHVRVACLHHGSALGQLHPGRPDAMRDPGRHQPRHFAPGSAFWPAADASECAWPDPDGDGSKTLRWRAGTAASH